MTACVDPWGMEGARGGVDEDPDGKSGVQKGTSIVVEVAVDAPHFPETQEPRVVECQMASRKVGRPSRTLVEEPISSIGRVSETFCSKTRRT
jgi:hypothetical protein